ncbi:MAG: MFS transporter [Sphingobium sp.]|nr:MAG: MFS transporter [Sphingobium sp.]
MDEKSGPWWKGITAYQWLVFAVASGAWLFDTMDQRLFSLARVPALGDLMGLPPSHIDVQAFAKVVTAVFLVGWGLGGLIIGPLGDRYGRVRLLAISILLYSICTGITALCQTAVEFAALRFITGLGIGGVFGLAVAIIVDTVDGRARLAMLAGLQILSTVGNVGSAFVKMGVDDLARQDVIAADAVWRWLFAIGALPALIAIVALVGLNEPRPWRDRMAQGKLPRGAFGAYVDLFGNRQERRGLLIGSLLAIAGVIGLWGIGEYAVDLQHAVFTAYYEPRLGHEAAGPVVAAAKNWAYMLQMAGGAAGMLIFTMIADRRGRRPAFLTGFAAAFFVTVFVYARLETPLDAYWMMPLMGAAQFSLFAGFSIYLPELFGSAARGTGVSFTYNLGRFAAAAGSFGSAWLSTGLFGGFPAPDPLRYSAMAMCLIFLVGFAAAWHAPETRGQPLPA